MRAVLDANIFISYLLSPDSESATIRIVEAAFTGAYTLVVPSGVITELMEKSSTKPYLRERVTPDQAMRLARLIATVGELLPELDEPYPQVGNDRKDDYLFAHAVLGQADFLVSGDKGVQRVQQLGQVRIASPTEFLDALIASS